MIEVKNLTKRFAGVTAVDGLTLSIKAGETVGLVGPNGSGKTTLVNLLSGVMNADAGEILVNEKNIERQSPEQFYQAGVARTFQNVSVFEQMTVGDNVMLARTRRPLFQALREKNSVHHQDQVAAALQEVGLWEKRGQLAKNLSYGQRKLLEIARVISLDAPIILWDEPFAGLFAEMIKQVRKIFQKLQNEGKTMVLIEHNLALVKELCPRLVVLDSGQLLADGKPVEVLREKKVIEAYLGD